MNSKFNSILQLVKNDIDSISFSKKDKIKIYSKLIDHCYNQIKELVKKETENIENKTQNENPKEYKKNYYSDNKEKYYTICEKCHKKINKYCIESHQKTKLCEKESKKPFTIMKLI